MGSNPTATAQRAKAPIHTRIGAFVMSGGRDDRRRSAGSAPAPATEKRRARRGGRAAGPGWPAGVYWAFRLLRERTKRTSSQIATITSARKTTNSTISTMPSFLKKLPFFFAFFFHFDTLDLDTVVK